MLILYVTITKDWISFVFVTIYILYKMDLNPRFKYMCVEHNLIFQGGIPCAWCVSVAVGITMLLKTRITHYLFDCYVNDWPRK